MLKIISTRIAIAATNFALLALILLKVDENLFYLATLLQTLVVITNYTLDAPFINSINAKLGTNVQKNVLALKWIMQVRLNLLLIQLVIGLCALPILDIEYEVISIVTIMAFFIGNFFNVDWIFFSNGDEKTWIKKSIFSIASIAIFTTIIIYFTKNYYLLFFGPSLMNFTGSIFTYKYFIGLKISCRYFIKSLAHLFKNKHLVLVTGSIAISHNILIILTSSIDKELAVEFSKYFRLITAFAFFTTPVLEFSLRQLKTEKKLLGYKENFLPLFLPLSIFSILMFLVLFILTLQYTKIDFIDKIFYGVNLWLIYLPLLLMCVNLVFTKLVLIAADENLFSVCNLISVIIVWCIIYNFKMDSVSILLLYGVNFLISPFCLLLYKSIKP